MIEKENEYFTFTGNQDMMVPVFQKQPNEGKVF